MMLRLATHTPSGCNCSSRLHAASTPQRSTRSRARTMRRSTVVCSTASISARATTRSITRGVHFVALDNVSRGRPEGGREQLAWLKKDVARFPKTAPIVVFTHRPLFDLKPEWEWFTADGDDVMNVLAPYENVTVLYGHIHRHHFQQNGRVKHYAARSLIFAFNDPATNEDKKQLPFNKDDPFKELGIRQVAAQGAGDKAMLAINEVVLAKAEFSGLSGMQQMIKHNDAIGGGSSNDAD